MPTSVHDRTTLDEFLAGEFRQVWAVDRVTGQRHYLAEGEAETVREVAKRDWCCPVPGCLVQITTVGGTSRRHHFKHLGASPHDGSTGESEAHLAAKAMLADWAERRLPGVRGASVQEEIATEKDPETSRYRRADVMVTWPDATKTAFEVEYKNYKPEDWALKQSDYDADTPPVRCVWLMGHLKVKRPRAGSYDAADPLVVRVPLLAQHWLRAGRVVLVVNPVTREIGTLVSRQMWGGLRYPYASDTEARLFVDSLDDCELDQDSGIVTPTMRQVAAAEAARQEQARIDAERLAAEKAKQADRANWLAELEARNNERWAASPLKPVVEERWPDGIPQALTTALTGTHSIHALPVHWHTAIYEARIHAQPAGTQFTVTDCWVTLASNDIQKNWDNRKSFKALIGFLELLQRANVIRIDRNQHGNVSAITVTGHSIDEQPARAARSTAATAAATRDSQPAPTPRRTPPALRLTPEEIAAHEDRVQAAQAEVDRRAALDQAREDHERRWNQSALKAEVEAAHDGTIPPHIAWLGGDHLNAIAAPNAYWHAAIYMPLIHKQPTGTIITINAAHNALSAAGIDTFGDPSEVAAAIRAYLYNLAQRGILDRPDNPATADAYTIKAC